ncbi:PREDICTED: ribonuclease P protein subunit p20-like isoform X1 [Polistes canadensis]|uniref:ribonuclease P protein subunit p20-like isoform X1 n=1 Tax=Polistes canadensis TaxID=91411 RepID=UPI000718DF46|nr:PREDICTED: ribonuclease P protein subunit p20-like isoform X1 [Polistes canadensis]
MAEKHGQQSINKNKSKNINAMKTVFPNNNFVGRKRQPTRLNYQTKLHVCVTKRTSFKTQLEKCKKLFNTGSSEIVIHGLGAAVERTCNLALQLKEIYHNILELDVKTATVKLMDDIKQHNDDHNGEMNFRRNSAIHIRIFRKEPVGIISTKKTKYGL